MIINTITITITIIIFTAFIVGFVVLDNWNYPGFIVIVIGITVMQLICFLVPFTSFISYHLITISSTIGSR
jgi:hypothetical protein